MSRPAPFPRESVGWKARRGLELHARFMDLHDVNGSLFKLKRRVFIHSEARRWKDIFTETSRWATLNKLLSDGKTNRITSSLSLCFSTFLRMMGLKNFSSSKRLVYLWNLHRCTANRLVTWHMCFSADPCPYFQWGDVGPMRWIPMSSPVHLHKFSYTSEVRPN